MTKAQNSWAHKANEIAVDEGQESLVDDSAENLFERAPCGYLFTRPDGMIVKVNQTFLSLTGYERSDLVDRASFADLLTAGGRIYHETHYAPMLQAVGHAREIALDIVKPDGSRLPVLVNANLDRDGTGAPRTVRIAVFEATERREYERELLRAKQRAEISERRASSLAQTLQQTLIPHRPPDIDGLELSAEYRPAGDGTEVGGDFYDVFEIGPNDCVVAVGDVCGKGVGAATVTALARHTIRAAAVRETRPSEMLHLLNEALLADSKSGFCSVTLIVLRRTSNGWEATACSGGHPLPYLARANQSPHPFGTHGTVLGVIAEPSLTDKTTQLQQDDLLVLYTDGVTEGRQKGSDQFGEVRLGNCIRKYMPSPKTITTGLLEEVLDFQSGYAQDDIAIVVLKAVPPV